MGTPGAGRVTGVERGRFEGKGGNNVPTPIKHYATN